MFGKQVKEHSFFKKIKELIFKDNGFTLIEAIITVVIVGIIVVPITSIFIGSLNNTVVAREQLRANQTAQLYIENLKLRSYEQLEYIFSGGDITTISALTIGENQFFKGLPAVPENMEVTLSIDRALYASEYAINKRLPEDEIKLSDVDLYIDIFYDQDNGDKPTINFYDPSDLSVLYTDEIITTGGFGPTGGAEYKYELTFLKDTDDLIIKDGTNIVYTLPLSDVTSDDVLINAGVLKEDLGLLGNQATFTFNIKGLDNNTTASAFILRESSDYVDPLVMTSYGKVSVNYNIMLPNPSDYYITKIQVQVTNSQGVVLATMGATKIYD